MAADAITDEQAQFFLDNGYLIVRGVLHGEELARVRAAMDRLTRQGIDAPAPSPDFAYAPGHKTGARVLRRIEYVIDKSDECKALLGHPFVLRSVEKLMGRDLIPTWDSMVLKLPGEGIIVPWHRDAGAEHVGDKPIFNVDFYMDEADYDTCVWLIPGSHKWSAEQAREITAREGFSTDGAVPALMQPGDVLFHDILVLHGSPANSSDKLRRVVYYEFRTAHVEDRLGPHVPAYIPLKQRVLLACIERRSRCGYARADEVPYRYAPPAPYDQGIRHTTGDPETFRYAHADFWRR